VSGAILRRGAGGSRTLTATWSGFDPFPDSGVTAWDVAVTHGGSAIDRIAVLPAGATAMTLTGVPGQAYTLGVRAVDAAGNVSTSSYASVTMPWDDSSAHTSRGWRSARNALAYGASFRRATAGATATFTLTGRRFALLVDESTTPGVIALLLDGKRVGKVSVRASGTRWAVSLPVRASSARKHTVGLRVLSGSVRLDGAAVVGS
jgi:hypothetical protein